MAQENVNECWRSMPRNTNYEVSSMGKVRRTRTGRILKTRKDRSGYERVNLNCNGEPEIVRIHRLVAIAFLDNPDDKPNIDHIDHNKANNRMSNLRWCNQQENLRNMSRHSDGTSKYKGVGRTQSGNWYASITHHGIRKYLGTFRKKKDAARAYNTKALELNPTFAHLNVISDDEDDDD